MIQGIQSAYDKFVISLNKMPDETEPCAKDLIIFNETEVENMAETFRDDFVANGAVAFIYKYGICKNFKYVIKYRYNGRTILASATSIGEAKRLFIDAVNAGYTNGK